MSLNKTQLDALIHRNCKTATASYSVADMTADENLAMDYVLSLIFNKSSVWQFDDTNFTDYPILTTDLVSGQRDYAFTTDNSGNLILDIFRVMVMGEDGVFRDLEAINQNEKDSQSTIADGQNLTGTPTSYAKTGNGIFLDKIPSYNKTGGLKIYVNREMSHFTTADTTKKAGFAGHLHEYLALRPSYYFAMRNGLTNKNDIGVEMMKFERLIQEYYGQRNKDEPKRMRVRVEDTR